MSNRNRDNHRGELEAGTPEVELGFLPHVASRRYWTLSQMEPTQTMIDPETSPVAQPATY